MLKNITTTKYFKPQRTKIRKSTNVEGIKHTTQQHTNLNTKKTQRKGRISRNKE